MQYCQVSLHERTIYLISRNQITIMEIRAERRTQLSQLWQIILLMQSCCKHNGRTVRKTVDVLRQEKKIKYSINEKPNKPQHKAHLFSVRDITWLICHNSKVPSFLDFSELGPKYVMCHYVKELILSDRWNVSDIRNLELLFLCQNDFQDLDYITLWFQDISFSHLLSQYAISDNNQTCSRTGHSILKT